MKTFRLFVVFTVLLFAGVAVPAPARADAEVSFDFFYESLAPYGEWINVGDYGLCWRPTDVDPDWTPYSDGYWAFTDAGWTWVSYEDFGGIVYHYGRWIRLDDADGWCWTPDYEWGPAWVSWRSNDDYVGWAPLPPEARWQRDVGIGIWVDRTCDIGPGYYNFCHTRDFGAPVLRGVIINRGQNVTIIRNTVNITNITYNTGYFAGPVIYNGGPNFERINRVSARQVPALRLVQNTKFDSAHWRDHRGPGGRLAFNAQTVGNQLLVPAPRVTPPSDPSALRSQAKRTIGADKVGRGWGLVKNPEVQKELRQEMQRQSKGFTPETAPARAVAAADLKAVPTKADLQATPTATGGRERSGRGQRPEGVAVQPNPGAPTTPVAGHPNLKPFNGVTEPGQNPKSQNPATATFTPTPRGPDGNGPGGPGRNRSRTVDTNPQQPQQPQQPDRTAEQAKARAEQERAAQQKQAEMATQQQKQAEAAAQQQKQAEMATQQRKQAEIAAQQQKQAEMAAQQRKQAERDSQQQRQAEAAAQQQKQAEMAMRQKQAAAQQEAAKAQAEEYRRRQQQQQQQQQQPQQQQQQRGADPRRGQQDGDRERARQQDQAQRNAQAQQQQQRQQQQREQPQQQQRQQQQQQQQREQPQQQQRQQQAQPQQQRPQQPQQQNNQPSRSDGKDKDKDKKGN